MTGHIRCVYRSRSCGFIRASDGQEVFFHAADLEGARIDQMEDRIGVRFDLVPDAVSGPRAVRVRLANKSKSAD